MADHPLGPATDHRLSKLLPCQLANQMRALPWADSFFCFLASGVLALPKADPYALLTHPPLETPLLV
ncbi:hypothetical protein Golob_025386 [Gossypium lobatum]|uniref:Uncharacterized protein n=1 Tax=Gossypium lobatum TaxID=34289 RepID=A0A7J8NFR0_9ROSI|nr:hypothetical protein [Gossypium lobatum]